MFVLLNIVTACQSNLMPDVGAVKSLCRFGVMAPSLRKVPTASGATVVQIVEKKHGRHTVVEHLGSAHTDTELAVVMQIEQEKLYVNQPILDLDESASGGRLARDRARVEHQASLLLVEVIRAAGDGWVSTTSRTRRSFNSC